MKSKIKNKSLEKVLELANKGNIEAINDAANRYYNGIDTEKNLEKAFELWTDACMRGSITATYNVAVSLLFGNGTIKNEKKAFDIFKRLAEKEKHAKSMFYLGEIYYWGLGLDANYEKALFYYNKALKGEPQNLKAKFCIAYAYYVGKGIEKNYEKAYTMFYKLVKKDKFEDALFYLGEFYYLGRVVEQDYQKALSYFKESLKYNRNIYSSKIYLGEMYLLGRGVESNCEEAKTYFESVLNEEHDDAYYKLGLIYSGKYGICKDEQKAKEYFDKIEIDLCITLIFYVLALRPEEEQNLNKIYELLNSQMEVVQHFVKQLPIKHPASLFHNRLMSLSNEEYNNIVERLKIKIEKCRNDNKFLNIFKLFDNEEDVVFYANCVVKSYDYLTINDYVRYLLNNKDDAALIFVGKLFINGKIVEKDIKKGLEYLLASKKQSSDISKENRDSCIAHIELTTKNPEIQLLLGKYYLEIPYYKAEGIKLIQKVANQGYEEANEIITNVLQEIRNDYKLKYPEDIVYECLFEIEKITKDSKIQSFLVDYSEEDIKENKDFERLVKGRCFDFIKAYANTGLQVAKNTINDIMQQIKNNYKNKKELSEEELEIIYKYTMNSYEKEKIIDLNIEEKIKLLQTDDEQVDFWNNSLKYIDEIGYMVVQWIRYFCKDGGNIQYFLKTEPTMDLNKARIEITKIIDEIIKEI